MLSLLRRSAAPRARLSPCYLLASHVSATLPLSLPLCSHALISVRHLAKGKGKEKKGKEKKGKGGGKAMAAADGDDEDSDWQLDIEAISEQMAKPLLHLQREFSGMQTGRATPTMLDNVQVDVGDGPVMLPMLAKIMAQGPQALTVSCFEAAHVQAAVKAIERDGGGGALRAEQAGKVIKVNVPRPTQESRQAMAKHIKVLAEAAKTAVRNHRAKAMKNAKGAPSKEAAKTAEKSVEAATKTAVDKVDAAAKAKEKEILTI